MEFVEISGARIYIVGAIRGLVSEGEKVKAAIEGMHPDAVALSISKEQLVTLQKMEDEDAELSNVEEEVYARELCKFGKVRKPPPCFMKAVEICSEKGIECLPLDMNDAQYTEAFVNSISTIELIMQSMRTKRLAKRKFKAETPEDFVLEFDKRVNRSQGYRKLERLREEHMARRLRDMTRIHRNILAVVELERAEGVRTALNQLTQG